MRHRAAVLAVIVVLAACGGGSSGPSLTRAQLVTRVNDECLKLQQASTDLQNAQDPNAKGPTVAHYLDAGAAQLRIHAEADVVPGLYAEVWIDACNDLVRRHLPVQV